jgi:hypothetical protein
MSESATSENPGVESRWLEAEHIARVGAVGLFPHRIK